MILLIFHLLLLFYPFTKPAAIRLDSSSSDEEIIYGSLVLPWNDGRPFVNYSSSNEEIDIEAARLSEPHKTCHLRLTQFLRNDRQFKRAFPTENQRRLFTRNVFESLKEKEEIYFKRITTGKIVDNYRFDEHTDRCGLELLALLLNYIDRQSTDFLPEYSQSQTAVNKLTRSVIKFRCSNHFYWNELTKLLKISRSDLVGHVCNLPFVTDNEKDIYKSYNQRSKRLNLITALPLALLSTNYWYLTRLQLSSSTSTVIELILIYIIFLYLFSIYSYEHFLFEHINHQIKNQF